MHVKIKLVQSGGSWETTPEIRSGLFEAVNKRGLKATVKRHCGQRVAGIIIIFHD